jgi:hypothetical protein
MSADESSYDTLIREHGSGPEARVIGRVLARIRHEPGRETQHYVEETDAFDFWRSDTALVVQALATAPVDRRAAVRDALIDGGLHDPTDPEDAACLDADVDDILVALDGPTGASS